MTGKDGERKERDCDAVPGTDGVFVVHENGPETLLPGFVDPVTGGDRYYTLSHAPTGTAIDFFGRRLSAMQAGKAIYDAVEDRESLKSDDLETARQAMSSPAVRLLCRSSDVEV